MKKIIFIIQLNLNNKHINLITFKNSIFKDICIGNLTFQKIKRHLLFTDIEML